jgi:hypothetical protein
MGFFDGVPYGDEWFHDTVSCISKSMNTTVRSADLINSVIGWPSCDPSGRGRKGRSAEKGSLVGKAVPRSRDSGVALQGSDGSVDGATWSHAEPLRRHNYIVDGPTLPGDGP